MVLLFVVTETIQTNGIVYICSIFKLQEDLNMIIFELNKEDIAYAERISDLAEMSLVIEEPRSFSSELNTIVQVGVELAPYAITGVSLIIVELLKNRKKIKIQVTKDGFVVEGEEEKAIEIAEKLIQQKKEEEARSVLCNLLSAK